MWKIIGTAVQGRGHVKKDIPVQDKISYVKGDVNVIALADGAGSAKLSHYGAECVVETICHTLQQQFDYIFQQEDITVAQQYIIDTLLAELTKIAEEHEENIKEFASTLLCVAVKEEKGLILHLGDGEIGAIRDGELMEISSASNGEFANATFFVTSSNSAYKLKLFKSSNILKFSSLFLMSDGAAESFYSKQYKRFSDVLKSIFQKATYLPESIMNDLLTDSFETYVKMKTNDDCAFIGMTLVDNSGSEFTKLPFDQRKELFQPFADRKKFSIGKSERILDHLQEPLTIEQLQRKLGVKHKYLKSSLNVLAEMQVIQEFNGKYKLARR